MASRRKKHAPTAPEPTHIEFETFRKVDAYARSQMEVPHPSCWNGDVRVRRYRVTIELIDEPVEIIQARLIELWAHEDNPHRMDPLCAEAARHGLNLRTCGVQFGSKAARRG